MSKYTFFKKQVGDGEPWKNNAVYTAPIDVEEAGIKHGARIEVHGKTPEAAVALRDYALGLILRKEWVEWCWDEEKIDWNGELCLAEQAGGNFIITRISNPSHWLKLDVQRFIPLSAFGAKTPQTKSSMTLLQRLKIAWRFVTGSK